jgi:putative flavoprotein involved in K+ transport
VGRVLRIEGATASLEPGLEESLAAGDAFVRELLQRIDGHVVAEGTDAPEADAQIEAAPLGPEAESLDLEREGITSILWASGFRPDYSWIHLPLVDAQGWAIQERGVTRSPGLYVVGLNWMHKRKSALLCGVGEDAEHIVGHLVERG